MKPLHNDSPRISVIMPVYNVQAYVEEALRSVLSQTFGDFELIAVDDGSTDASLNIVQTWASSDSRIRIISQRNKGLAAARNTGIMAARGKYLCFFDSDDLLDSDTLAICMEQIERHKLDFITFSADVFSDLSEHNRFALFPGCRKPDILVPHTGQKLLLKLMSLNAYSASACLYLFSRELLDSSGLRFDEGFLHEDEAFTILIFCAASRAVSLEKCLFKRRIRAQSIMTCRRTMANVEGMIQAAAKIGDFCSSHDELDRTVRSVLKRRQRGLLRNGVNTAQDIGLYSRFVAIARRRFGLPGLFLIDPVSIFYIRFGNFFFRARKIKRFITKSLESLKHRFVM